MSKESKQIRVLVSFLRGGSTNVGLGWGRENHNKVRCGGEIDGEGKLPKKDSDVVGSERAPIKGWRATSVLDGDRGE